MLESRIRVGGRSELLNSVLMGPLRWMETLYGGILVFGLRGFHTFENEPNLSISMNLVALR